MRARSSKNTGRTYRDGETFATFLAANGGESAARRGTSTLSRAVFRASTSRTPGSEKGSRDRGADCGANSLGSFAYYDRDSLSWRMWVRSFFEDSTEFSGTWPRSGTMRSGIVFRLAPLVPRISAGVVSLLLPTPSATEFACKDVEKLKTRREKLKEKYGNNGFGLTLSQYMAVMLPTLRADGQDNAGDSNSRRIAKRNGTYIGLTLNPAFVEWMMGFPHPSWTELSIESTGSAVSATPSCRKSRSGSDED